MHTIQVLMSTYNGERYLREQIDSILQQENVNVRLLIRDDGSSDRTKEVIGQYLTDDRVKLQVGNNLGYRKSFIWLLDNAPKAEYYAFSDQDDVWEKQKLSAALSLIENNAESKPILYTSALKRVNENLDYLGIQGFSKLKLDCYSEFVRHRFAGCTYVFNEALRKVCFGGSKIDNFGYSHDGFLSLMCWLTGGEIIYDETPHILFRRHGNNASADGFGKIDRIKHELAPFTNKKYYKSNIMKVIAENYFDFVLDEYKPLVENVAEYRTNRKKRKELICDRRLDCGIPIANFIFKCSILFKCM